MNARDNAAKSETSGTDDPGPSGEGRFVSPAVAAAPVVLRTSVFDADDRPITPPDMAATILHALGIDPATTLHTPLGRPVELASGGRAVLELFA